MSSQYKPHTVPHIPHNMQRRVLSFIQFIKHPYSKTLTSRHPHNCFNPNRSKVTGFLCSGLPFFVSLSFRFADMTYGLLLQRDHTLLRQTVWKRGAKLKVF